MQIKGHEIPLGKTLLSGISAGAIVVLISLAGRQVFPLAHAQTPTASASSMTQSGNHTSGPNSPIFNNTGPAYYQAPAAPLPQPSIKPQVVTAPPPPPPISCVGAAVCFGNGVKVKDLSITRNLMHGSKGVVLGNGATLENAQIKCNGFNGPIPPECGSQKKAQPSGGVSINGNGNCNATGANSSACNVYGSHLLTYNDLLAGQILDALKKVKPIRIMGVGSQSDMVVAEQFGKFLQDHGRTILGFDRTGMLVPPPSKPITIRETASNYVIVIDPAVIP